MENIMNAIVDLPKEPLSVTLMMTQDVQKQLMRHQGAIALAESYTIDSMEVANMAALDLKNFKASVVQVKGFYDGFVSPAKQIIENAKSLFTPAKDNLERGIEILSKKLTDFQESERLRIAEENRQREIAERKQRQEAEKKAAAERARSAEKAAEAQRQAEEAEAERQRLVAAGDARGAAAAAAEAAAAEEKSRAIVENGETKALDMQMTASATVSVVAAPTKIAGFVTRKNWKAELADNTNEDQAKVLICGAIAAGRTDLIALLNINFSAADKMAKALENHFNVAGLKAKNLPVAASR
jgi:regulator of protease activity HflC (stomatin/prohibitin superfamily)